MSLGFEVESKGKCYDGGMEDKGMRRASIMEDIEYESIRNVPKQTPQR